MKIKEVGTLIRDIYHRLGQVDCPDEVSMQDLEPELQASLEKVKTMERSYESAKASPKGGKGSSNKVVETVTIDPRVVKTVIEKSKIKEEVSQEREER